ncbi:MAG: hypothetical protein MK132_03825 [Lentisphaerales bacterium]|nr:hypothetical protein [Lentisphaerales bacterium]
MSKKSEYTAYHYEELKKIQHFGKPGFSKLIMHIGHAASFILPSMSMWRVLGRAVFESGNVDDIILYGDVCKKMFKGSDTLITGLVVGAIGRMFLENAETAKNVQKLSPETYKFFKRANDAVSNWRASKVDEADRHKLIKDKGSILVSMIMPSLRGTSGIITEESLEPSRKMEYSFFEKIYFILLNSLVFIVTISVIALAFIARFMTKGKAFIISLSLREWLSHVGKTILVPLLCYQLFKLLPFSSYENSFRESFWGLGLEIFTLTVLITYWSSYVILKKHSDRLEILDLEERSPVNLKTYSLVFFSMILLSIVVCFSFNQQVVDLLYGIDILVRLDALREGESSKGISALEYLEMIVASLIFLGFLWRTLWQQASMKAASVFSLASGMALHLAFMALVLGLYSTVYLGTVEKHYFEKDTLLVNLDNPTLFTSVEEHVVRKLKQQILESSD